VAPLIAGATVMTIGKPTTAIYPMLAGFLALLFISLTINSSKRIKHLSKKQNEHPSRDFKQEMKTLIIVGRRLWPFMLLTINLALMESAFWTIAPLLENVSSSFAGLGGIFLAVSMVPSLVISWSVEPLTRSFGKKKTAFYTFLFANLLLLTVGYLTNAYMILLIIFLVNLLEAITFPAASAAFADYLKESNSYDNEIIAAKDFAGNIGYIIGPLVAGISLDLIGDLKIFTVFATVGVITSLILILFTPKKIPFYDKNVKNDS
jgi:MFS family permease